MGYFKTMWEDFKAYRRDEVRVAPKGVRGRVYAEKDAPTSPGHSVASKGKAELEMIVTRVNGDVERIVVPATVERT